MTATIGKGSGRYLVLSLSSLALMLGSLGCGRLPRSTERPSNDGEVASVQAVTNTSAVELTVDDVIIILRQLGHTDQQVYEIGEDLRNALLYSGGAKISVGGRVDSALRVDGSHIWIQSLSRGSFIYDVKSREFTLAPQSATSVPRGRTGN